MEGISLYRVYALSRPLACRQLKPGTIHKALTGLAIISVLYMLSILAMGQYFLFDPYLLSCQVSGQTDPNPLFVIYQSIGCVIFLVVPVVGIVIANLAILVRVAKAQGGIPGINAVKTVSYVSWALVISVTPTSVRFFLQVSRVPLPSWFYIAGLELLFMNTLVNPIIYAATNQGFQTFLSKIISRNQDSTG